MQKKKKKKEKKKNSSKHIFLKDSDNRFSQ